MVPITMIPIIRVITCNKYPYNNGTVPVMRVIYLNVYCFNGLSTSIEDNNVKLDFNELTNFIYLN